MVADSGNTADTSSSSGGSNHNGVRQVAVGRRDRDEAVRLYQETDLPAEEIGKRFGVSRQTVHRWIQDAGVPLRGPMGPRSRDEQDGGDPPSVGLLGRLMDSLDQVRRDLAAQDAYIHAQSETLQRQLDALTVRQGEHHGANEAHMATAAEYQNYMRGQIATLSSSLERLTAMLQQIVSPRDPT